MGTHQSGAAPAWAEREARRIQKAVTLLHPGIPGPGGVWADVGCGDGMFLLDLCEATESTEFWKTLFEKAGAEIKALFTTDPEVDSTGVELGFLLTRSTAKNASALTVQKEVA